MSSALSDCQTCLDGTAAATVVGFFELTTKLCVDCGQIVDVDQGSGKSGQLNHLKAKATSSEPEIQADASDAEISTRMYLIQNNSDVGAILNDQLEVSPNTKCCFYENAMVALADIASTLRSGGSIRVVLVNPEVMQDQGSAFLYSIRALEMSLGSPSTPILVLGETVSSSTDRAIKECKNAKFVSIGRKTDTSILAKRYLTVIRKLTNG